MKKESTVWENILANNTSDKGLISKIKVESNEQNELMSKIEPEAWKHGTD